MPARSWSRGRLARSCARRSIPMRRGCWLPPSMAPNAASAWRRFRVRRRPSIARPPNALLRRDAGLWRPAASTRFRQTCKSIHAESQDASLPSLPISPQRHNWNRRPRRQAIGVSSFSHSAGSNGYGHVRPSWIGLQSAGARTGRVFMRISNEGLLVILFVGLVAGWLAGKVVRGTGFGIIGDILVGIAGAIVANFLFPKLGIAIGTGLVSEIVYSAIGAILLLLVVRLVRRAGRF